MQLVETRSRIGQSKKERRSREAKQLTFASDEERLESFGRALDALRTEVEGTLGAADVSHMDSIYKLSRRLEIAGRTLIVLSLDPVTFTAGVASLTAHKALELMEIGHMVLHSAYDRIPGADAYKAKTFYWKAPIDEQSWCVGHNVRHHQYTNIAGRDPDLDFGGLRLSSRIPHRLLHHFQPLSNVFSWAGFALAIQLHVTGMIDIYLGKGEPHVVTDRSWKGLLDAHRNFLRKPARYYGREFVLFPVLSGPLFLKTLIGNALSELGRDLYAGAVIYCGHVGADDYDHDARAGSRARWYAMQVEGAYNIEMPKFMSILAGALDKQIEHHLFPRLPPNRLREIAPRVKEICEQHGIKYRSAPFVRRVGEVLRDLSRLSFEQMA